MLTNKETDLSLAHQKIQVLTPSPGLTFYLLQVFQHASSSFAQYSSLSLSSQVLQLFLRNQLHQLHWVPEVEVFLLHLAEFLR